ncbi:hypothetical protein LYSHEL_21770 [Lysobacter helvus]|uniref:Alpha/beta hydrolase n=2 Tax=Lysobacteraceae TaxID=32033 RepID=A0ABN6FTU5_9GAMM|nr:MULTISPECIES: hypothetical protein [Lysobacter]BCT93154.1 hypothetical protein LYSCAS_21780 [Lysobacter caseinilyticus]BCT96306.1 hypothetical protein LYSHEL_21770 [Lysobacter helvus]
MLEGLADPANARRFDPSVGGYARYTAAQLLPVWDRSIPVDDKSQWRDPAVATAYTAAAVASDPDAAGSPPTFRAPQGAMEDSFLQAMGRRLFDASSITARVLLVRSEKDFWSRPEDVAGFIDDASHARSVQVIELTDATHLAHLDRAPHGRDRLIEAVAKFLED